MTEAEWLTCVDPREMLGFLAGDLVTLVDAFGAVDERERMRLHVRQLLEGRRARFVACACSRVVGGLLSDENRRRVEGVEDSLDRVGGGADGAKAAAPRGERTLIPSLPLPP